MNATINAVTPADLGPRAALLVDRHAAYIQGFARIWEVRGGGGGGAVLCSMGAPPRTAGRSGGRGRPGEAPALRAHGARACALMHARAPRQRTPAPRLTLVPSPFNRTKASDRIEAVATEHFWMSGMYWGLTAMALMGRLGDMDCAAVADWVASCRRAGGGFGASPRNDAHLLYTLSAVQVRAGKGRGRDWKRRPARRSRGQALERSGAITCSRRARRRPRPAPSLAPLQILALIDRLDLVDADEVAACERAGGPRRARAPGA
jgi:hypothetical protein